MQNLIGRYRQFHGDQHNDDNFKPERSLGIDEVG